MESDRFDRLTRALTTAPSRRGIVQIAAAGVLAAIGWEALADEASAKRKKKKKKKKGKGDQGQDPGQPNPDVCQQRDCDECETCKNGRCQPVEDGTACSVGNICEGGNCVPLGCGNGGPCTVFVSNGGKAGDGMGGAAGADAFCQNTARTAGIAGDFKAWLSTSTSTPADRFTKTDKAGPYRLVRIAAIDGNNPPPLVANSFADLTTCSGGTCLQNAIKRTEDGVVLNGGIGVWTGTLATGNAAAQTCADFSGAGTGLTGNATAVNETWTDDDNPNPADCALDFRLYCFQQAI